MIDNEIPEDAVIDLGDSRPYMTPKKKDKKKEQEKDECKVRVEDKSADDKDEG